MERLRVFIVACLLTLVAATPALAGHSEAEAMDSARRVLIAMRVLAYDKALVERNPGPTVTIVILSTSSVESRSERELWQDGFALVPKIKVGGRPVRVVPLDFGSQKAFEAALAKLAPAAVIVGSDLTSELDAVEKVTRGRRVLTISRREDAVRGGLGMALVAGEQRDEIVINLEATRSEGVRFGAGLLQLARIVESE